MICSVKADNGKAVLVNTSFHWWSSHCCRRSRIGNLLCLSARDCQLIRVTVLYVCLGGSVSLKPLPCCLFGLNRSHEIAAQNAQPSMGRFFSTQSSYSATTYNLRHKYFCGFRSACLLAILCVMFYVCIFLASKFILDLDLKYIILQFFEKWHPLHHRP